ncbi:hydroxypyruvate isomerase family protein [Paenibacillus piri]|uniref:Glyoxylate-induced protein n=1 Tax=Paenibacillus piri TaxID=2547395 RepID=A0A4R5KT40_9BACL|nr:TIM barrel protein [Paenibacillus piri]TDF98050.1 glyoxylate-induced protein [Paenibacillus piri]
MLRFASHLEMNYEKDVAFRDRWLAAHRFGFHGCEFVWRLHDLAEVVDLKAEFPLHVSSLGGTTGFAVGGDRPVLIWPEDRERLARDVEKAVDYAKAVSCKTLIMVSGNLIPGWSVERHRREAVESLKYIAPIVEKAGVTVVIEPLNSKTDHKGIYCDSSSEAFRIIEETGSDHIKILYDVYHMQIMEGNLIETIQHNERLIGYYHLAKVPGRFEPLGGEVNFPAVLEAIGNTTYDGFIGLEYKPSGHYEKALERIKQGYPACFAK